MKIEAKHNSTKPAYAVGVALLVAAAVFAGCQRKLMMMIMSEYQGSSK